MTQDWRLVPVALAVWAGSWLAVGSPLPVGHVLGIGIAVAVVALFAAVHRHQLLALLLMAGYTALLLGAVRAHSVQDSVVVQWAERKHRVVATARISTEPHISHGQLGKPAIVVGRAHVTRLTYRDQAVTLNQPVTIFATGEMAQVLHRAAPGATYTFIAQAGPAREAGREPMKLSIRQQWREVSPPGLIDRLVNGVRGGLRQATAHLPPDQAALVPSLVVGDTYRISPEMKDQFRHTALAHLLAVSGANLTLMLGVLLALVRTVGVRGWAVRCVALAGVGFFVVLCRFEPSVIRAAVMGTITVASMGLGKGASGVRAIALTVTIVMFVDPWLARDFAFALSVSACGGIIVWASTWATAMTTWAPRWLAEAWCVPLAAQIATQPLITILSGEISQVGIFANILAGPFVGPATIIGLATAVASIWPPLARLVAWVAGWSVQPIVWIAGWASDAEGAIIPWPGTVLGISVLILVGALAVSAMPKILKRRVTSLVMAIVLVLVVWARPGTPGWPGPWQVVFCNVGQGDATVLRAGEGTALLVDTGPNTEHTMRCLRQVGITRIPMVVLTHFHADHVAGIYEVLDRYRPEVLMISPLLSPKAEAELIVAYAKNIGTRIEIAHAGQHYAVGDVRWYTVNAWLPAAHMRTAPDSHMENDSSVVAVADIQGLRVVLPGDAEEEGQRRALQHSGANQLQAHILKLPHHGANQQVPAFMEATKASIAIVSAGKHNDYGHPSSQALQMAHQRGMIVMQTPVSGSLAVNLADNQIDIRERGDG